jgi:hypothetical protein
MKLIIKEYLASLRERKELDALLPDLLSQMGLEVFSKPGIGNRQYGVDIAAFGSIDEQSEKVYLFSVKAGNLGRKDWNSGSLQDLQPSLDEIITVYISTHLPIEYRSKPIEICICFGGDLKEEVRLNISQYENAKKTDDLTFSEWGGERLSLLIEKYLLTEELMPEKFRHFLRKSLALLDEPDASYKYFTQLVELLTCVKSGKDADKITAIRQLNICLWILFAWCREANNLEAAYLSSEFTLLHAWELSKPFLGKEGKASEAIRGTLYAVQNVYQLVSTQYLANKILPHTDKLHGLSNAVHPSCEVDVNLKLFDVLGRIAMGGIWALWIMRSIPVENSDSRQAIQNEIEHYFVAIKQLISNNPILFSPYKDDQAIDITLATFLLALDHRNHKDIHDWLSQLITRARFNFNIHGTYPCNLYSYHELIEHPIDRSDSYREEVTAGSILYPIIAAFSALLGFDDIYNEIQDFKNKSLKHCNFQLWYPDETSEELFYTNGSEHGATLSDVFIHKTKDEFLEQVFKECHENSHFNEISAVKFGVWPIVFLACRHYRMPIPIHFLENLNISKTTW